MSFLDTVLLYTALGNHNDNDISLGSSSLSVAA